MSAHTKEPWPVADVAAFNWSRDLVQLNGGCLSLSDYLRAKVCVDACAGMSDPKAEIAQLHGEHRTALGALAWTEHERDALRAERDAIAAELEYAIDQMLRHDFGTLSVVPRLRAALARSQS